MMPISGVNTVAVQPLTTTEKVLGASKVQKPEEEAQSRQLKPVMDEYIPEEPQEPSGRYWMGRDEDGQPKIYFDDPERAADAPEQQEGAPEAEGPDPADQDAKGPEGKKDKGEVWERGTGKADRETGKLKKNRQELEQEGDTYRRQHAAHSSLDLWKGAVCANRPFPSSRRKNLRDPIGRSQETDGR